MSRPRTFKNGAHLGTIFVAGLALIFTADQVARKSPNIDWDNLGPEDAGRRETVHQMLAEGSVQSGQVFWHAAFIFQHGSKPDDYLLADALACAALAKGHPQAAWMAAATLDRYLANIGQP